MRNTAFVVALGIILLASLPARLEAQTPAEKGKAVFDAQKCSLCHSVAGKGNAKGALDGKGAKLTAAEIKSWLKEPAEMAKKAKAERKPAMKSFEKLPDADIDALVAYVSSLKK